jgi:putative PEP-CTERM system TPR-repeat lipoprotein
MRLRRYLDAGNSFGRATELLSGASQTRLLMQGLTGLAESQLALGNHDDARQAVSKLVELSPESMMTLFLSARIAFVDEDWKSTQQNLQRVLQLAPGFEPAQLLLGMAHFRGGNLSQAEMYLSTVVANSPSNVEARTLLAETRSQLRRVDLVKQTLSPMLSGEALNPRALAIAGRTSLESGEIDQGISYLEQSVAADPGSNELKLQLAAAYISSGRQADARKILDALEAGMTIDDEYRRELLQAAALYQDGEVESAIEAAKLVSERWPEKGEIQNLLGTMYLGERDFASARQRFELGAENSVDQLVPQRFLATIDIIEGDLDAARNRYQNILERRPETVWALVALARIAADSEDLGRARDLLNEARSADRAAFEPRALLARLHLAEGDYRDAETVAKEAISLDSSVAALHNILGLAMFSQRRFKEAAENFETAISLDDQSGEFRLNLAKAQNALGDTGDAEQTLEASLDRGNEDIPSAGMLIALKAGEGDFDEAMRLAKRLQEIHPLEQAPIAFEGEVLINKGDLAEAIRVYDRALALGPNRNIALRAHALIQREGSGDHFRPLLDYLDQRPLDTVMRQLLAQAYEEDEQLEKAVAQYEIVAEADPGNAAVLNNLAWNYWQIGDRRAKATARKAYELSPGDAPIVDTLGWILVQEGEAAEGVRLLQEAVSLNGERPEFQFHLAAGLAKLGRTEEARRTLESILENDQDFATRAEAEALLTEL